jgi:DNA-directed RNA polymerase specialized sigma24 family protein
MDWVHTLPNGRHLDELADPDGDTHEQVVSSLEAARLRRLLRNLPAVEQRVLSWRYGLNGERLAHRQVAARLGVSVGTAWTIEQRALGLLRGEYGLSEAA